MGMGSKRPDHSAGAAGRRLGLRRAEGEQRFRAGANDFARSRNGVHNAWNVLTGIAALDIIPAQ